MDREVQAVYVGEEVFDAGEGGAELGDQLGQVGNEPAALAVASSAGGVGDGPLDFFGQADVVHDHAGGLHEPGSGRSRCGSGG